jgi:hypothetical protein
MNNNSHSNSNDATTADALLMLLSDADTSNTTISSKATETQSDGTSTTENCVTLTGKPSLANFNALLTAPDNSALPKSIGRPKGTTAAAGISLVNRVELATKEGAEWLAKVYKKVRTKSI